MKSQATAPRTAGPIALGRALLAHPQIVKAGPAVGLFLLRYMRKFRVRDIGGHLVMHSHLPPLNHPAYGRFIREHLAGRSEGPSHAQVAVTSTCPQRCAYCYNRGRGGEDMDTPTILRVIRELQDLGVFWLGFTGGEPLLRPDLVEITRAAAGRCAVKLFTTGSGITPDLAARLVDAGLFSVSVSLDDRRAEVHDRARGIDGAFREALRALEVFLATPGLHVGISAVFAPAAIRAGEVEPFLEFAAGLGVHEAWLSEVKPSAPPFRRDDMIATEADRRSMVELQDRHNRNRRGALTVNYLGHFEGREHFGCNRGRKMIYVDARGKVSPCVFTPLVFGSVLEQPLAEIAAEMRALFPSDDTCFVNRTARLLDRLQTGDGPLDPETSRRLVAEAGIGDPPRFIRLHERPKRNRRRR